MQARRASGCAAYRQRHRQRDLPSSPCDSEPTSSSSLPSIATCAPPRARAPASPCRDRAHRALVPPSTPRMARYAVLHRDPAERPGLLVRPGEPEPCTVPRGEVGHVLAEQLDRPRRGGQITGDHVEQRRLAGAVRPEDRAPFARNTSRSMSRTASRPPKRRPTPRKRRVGSTFEAGDTGSVAAAVMRPLLLGNAIDHRDLFPCPRKSLVDAVRERTAR